MATRNPATFSLSRPMEAEGGLIAALVARTRRAAAGLGARMAARFLRWREHRETWAALRLLDDRQLHDFGMSVRPPDLSNRRFP